MPRSRPRRSRQPRARRRRAIVLDWERTRKAQAKLDAPFTPAVSLVRALDVALGLLLEEGLEAAFERHARLGRACREGAKAMGLELFSPDEERSAVVTAIRTPDGIDATEVVSTLRDRFGITIANGQGELKGKIFRIGHIGWFDIFDITTALAAVELTLADAGAEIERGVAVTRALEAWAEHTPGVSARASSSAKRSPRRASASCASAGSTSTSTATPTSPRRSAATTRS